MRSGRVIAPSLAVLGAWLLAPAPAQAHPWSRSSLSVVFDTGRTATLTWQLDGLTTRTLLPELDGNDDGRIDEEELAAGRARLLGYLDERVRITSAGAPCERNTPTRLEPGPGGGPMLVQRARCPSSVPPLRLEVTAFMEDVGGHRFVSYLELPGGRVVRGDMTAEHPYVIVADSGGDTTSTPPPGDRTSGGGFGAALVDGAHHVLTGADHLSFLHAVVVAIASFRHLALVVSSFTVAHSVTLALAAFGVVTVPRPLVEALVALSLVYVAAENLLLPEPTQRPALTFGFGLVHGLAFSEYFASLGLSWAATLPLLAGFNLGVELGQLAIVTPVFFLLRWWAPAGGDEASPGPRRRVAVVRVGSAIVGALGLAWLLDRTLDLGLMPF